MSSPSVKPMPPPHSAQAPRSSQPAPNKSGQWKPGLILFGLLAAVGLARVTQWLPSLIPPCGLKTLTGIPCPLCGSTRCLISWSHLNVSEAFRFNPLTATGFVLAGAYLWVSLLSRGWGRPWDKQLVAWIQRRRWPWLLLAAAVANWIYLFCSLPR
ncbi:MAG: DUF2752 domain-containing protein [Verrucomicrobiota bacterium]